MRRFEAEHKTAGATPAAAAPASSTKSPRGAVSPAPASKATTVTPTSTSKSNVIPSESDSKRTNVLLGVLALCGIIMVAIYMQSGTAKTASRVRGLVVVVEGLTVDLAQSSSSLGLTPNIDLLGVQGVSNSAPGSPALQDSSASQLGALASILSGAADSQLPIVATPAAYASPAGPSVKGPWASFLTAARGSDKWVSVVGGSALVSDGVSCGAVDLECVSSTTLTRCDPSTAALKTNPSSTPTCNANTKYFIPSNATDNDVVAAGLDAISRAELVFVHVDLLAQTVRTSFALNSTTSTPELLDMQVVNAVHIVDSIVGRLLLYVADRAAERFEDWCVAVVGTMPFLGATPVATQSTAPAGSSLGVFGGLTTYRKGVAASPPSAITAGWSVLDVAPTMLTWLGVTWPPAGSTSTVPITGVSRV